MSGALDVRILQVADNVAAQVGALLVRHGGSEPISKIIHGTMDLRDIAAELRTPAPEQITITAIRDLFAGATSDQDLAASWRDVAPSLPGLTEREQIGAVVAWITRMCVVTMDDGR
jgi:hypothetical protein